MGASVAAAAIIRKEKEIVARFRDRGATSPAHAINPDDIGVHRRVAWRILERRAIVRAARPGYFYLDYDAWLNYRAARRRRLAIVLPIVIILVIVFGVMVTNFLPRR